MNGYRAPLRVRQGMIGRRTKPPISHRSKFESSQQASNAGLELGHRSVVNVVD